MQQQDAEIQRLKQEIARQRREIEQIKLAKFKVEQKRQDCNLAFRDFEKAQEAANRDQSIALYRKGLYELGKILMAVGRRAEAQEEFEAALRINPDFKSARRELKALEAAPK
jgi:tetratricopeptide (TPR) repeat protein